MKGSVRSTVCILTFDDLCKHYPMMHYAFIFYHCSHFIVPISMESYEETAVMIKQQSELFSNDRVYVTPPERQLLKPTCG